MAKKSAVSPYSPNSGKLAITFLSMTIGFFFMFMGILKLTPSVSEEIYKMMRKIFIKMVRGWPLHSVTNWRPSPHTFRKVVGCTEFSCGLILALIPGFIKNIANAALLTSCLMQVYCHWMVKESMDKMTPNIVFSLLLICRLIIMAQIKHSQKKAAEQAAADAAESEEESDDDGEEDEPEPKKDK